MKTVKVRNIVIGEGLPKICVPIVGKNAEELIEEIAILKQEQVDVVEWRMDWFDQIMDQNAAIEMLKSIREHVGDLALLATFRTSKEGGEKAISNEDYVSLYKNIIATKLADLVDVELFTGDKEVQEIVEAAHANGVGVVMSNHDFDKTPACEEIVNRLTKMQELGADIPKIAVMPTCKQDVLTLLQATCIMHETIADRPIITMSMAGMGAVSRVCGEVFGSALTFGAAKKASAPGQVAVKDLATMLQLLHKSL